MPDWSERLLATVLMSVGGKNSAKQYCLMDFKEAIAPAAPRDKLGEMPHDPAERVVEGARHLSPNLGKRMLAVKMLGKSVFVRELLPQDLKLEIDQLTADEATKVAIYLAAAVGKAHSRQMNMETRKLWLAELERNRPHDLDAPTWLWKAVVELLGVHEKAYLEHCRRYALAQRAAY
jgi:uncharacterized protein (DUF2252 family)